MLTTGFYSVHLLIPQRFPLFILASSVCWSLQCLISALTQGAKVVTFLGSLVQSCCGEGGTLQTSLACVGALAVSRPHWVCPHSRHVAFPVYTAQAPDCSAGSCLRRALGCVRLPGLSCSGSGSRVLHKGADSVGPASCARPRLSSSGDQVLGEHTLPTCGVSYHLPHSSCWLPGCAAGAPSRVCRVSPPGN